ncbi:hypothetical protein I5U42_18680 [Stenotrophomonas maltophilia]|nr:hypothetical protein [Stenotrophomonas maltophilia]
MNRDEPLTPEERELARLLGRRAEQAPPPALDAAILAAARAAVDGPAASAVASPDAPRTKRARPRWPAVFGIAASMVFAIGIAWQLRPEPPPMPAGEAAVASAPPAADASTATTEGPDVHSDVAAAEPAVAPAAPLPAPMAAAAPRADAPAPTIARARKPAPVEAPVQAARSMAADAAADTAFEALPPPAPAAAPAPPAPAAYSAPVPVPVPAPAPAAALKARTASAPIANAAEAEQALMQDRIESTSMKRTASSRSAPGVMRRADAGLSADAVQAEVSADARLPRRQWLEKIRERRDEGQRDLARASLERYIQQYPESRLPRDLRPLLDD